MEGIENTRKVKSKMMQMSRIRRDMMKCKDSCKCSSQRGQQIIQLQDLSLRTMKTMPYLDEEGRQEEMIIEEDSTAVMISQDHTSSTRTQSWSSNTSLDTKLTNVRI
jgi:hypothetical protein